jgi:hypothetical protein
MRLLLAPAIFPKHSEAATLTFDARQTDANHPNFSGGAG